MIAYTYQLHPSGWVRRVPSSPLATDTIEKTATVSASDDLVLVLDVAPIGGKIIAGDAGRRIECTVELAADYGRAVAQLGHHHVRTHDLLPVCLQLTAPKLTVAVRSSPLSSSSSQLGVVPCATTLVLMMIRSGFNVWLPSALLWQVCCIGIIMWTHGIPLCLVRGPMLRPTATHNA